MRCIYKELSQNPRGNTLVVSLGVKLITQTTVLKLNIFKKLHIHTMSSYIYFITSKQYAVSTPLHKQVLQSNYMASCTITRNPVELQNFIPSQGGTTIPSSVPLEQQERAWSFRVCDLLTPRMFSD